jgi:hypothetical protein
MQKNWKGEEHNKLPRDFLGGRSSLSSPHYSSPTQLHCVKTSQHQQPQAPQTYENSYRSPVQQHLPQQEIQRTGLSLQVPTSTNNDTSKIATVLPQNMTELSEAVSDIDKLMNITKMALDLIKKKWMLELIATESHSI